MEEEACSSNRGSCQLQLQFPQQQQQQQPLARCLLLERSRRECREACRPRYPLLLLPQLSLPPLPKRRWGLPRRPQPTALARQQQQQLLQWRDRSAQGLGPRVGVAAALLPSWLAWTRGSQAQPPTPPPPLLSRLAQPPLLLLLLLLLLPPRRLPRRVAASWRRCCSRIGRGEIEWRPGGNALAPPERHPQRR